MAAAAQFDELWARRLQESLDRLYTRLGSIDVTASWCGELVGDSRPDGSSRGGARAGGFLPYGGGNGRYVGEHTGGFHPDGGVHSVMDALTGGSRPNGGDRGDGGLRYDGDGDVDCGVGSGYGISGGRGCHSHEQGAVLPMVLEGSALQVFDEMPLKDIVGAWKDRGVIMSHVQSDGVASEFTGETHQMGVIWDEEFGHSLVSRGGLLQQLAMGAEFVIEEELTVVSDEQDVVWDEELLQDLDSHDGLLRQLAQGGELMSGQQNVMESSLPPSFPCDLIPGDDNLTLLSKGTDMCSAHQVLDEMRLNVGWDDNMSQDCGLLKQFVQAGEDTKLTVELFTSSVVWDKEAEELHDEMPCKNVVWDDDLPLDRDMHNGLLKQFAGEKAVEQAMQDQRVWEQVNMVSSLSDIAVHEPFDEIPVENVSAPYLSCVVPLLPMSSEATADKGFNEMSLEMVVWYEELSMIESTQCCGTVVKDDISFSMSVAVPVFREMSWKIDGSSPCNSFTRLVLMEMLVWCHGGFSPGLCDHQWDMYVAAVRQWDPGIIRLLSDAVVEGRCSKTAISWKACGRAHKELLHILCAPRAEMHMLVKMIKKMQFHYLFYEFSGLLMLWDPRITWMGSISKSLQFIQIFTDLLCLHIIYPTDLMNHLSQDNMAALTISERCGQHEDMEAVVSLRYKRIAAVFSSRQEFEGTRCIKQLHLADAKALNMVIFSMIRPWNPGVREFRVYESKSGCLSAEFLQRKWATKTEHRGISSADHSVAWGQATFWRGGSVTPGPYSHDCDVGRYASQARPTAQSTQQQLYKKRQKHRRD